MCFPEQMGPVFLKDLFSNMPRYLSNCRVAGGIALAAGIKGNVTVVHGPRGCAFTKRISSTRYLDVPVLVCTNLDENDTIFGSENKLAQAIYYADQQYQPKLITVLLTCVTGIIGDDVQGVIAEAKKRVKARVIWADTSGFSHRDLKDLAKELLKEEIHAYRHPRQQRLTLVRGGAEQLLKCMVEQLMEDPRLYGGVKEKSAFIFPTRWFHKNWADYLAETEEIFRAAGVRIKTFPFMETEVEEIIRLPQYKLNLMGYSQWPKLMKEKFGTEYLPDFIEYYNSPFAEAIESFYLDAAKILGVEKEISAIVARKLAWLHKELEPYRQVFEGKKLAVLRGLPRREMPYEMPHLIVSLLVNLGFRLVYMDLDYDYLYNWSLDRQIINEHLAAIRSAFAGYEADLELQVEATLEEEVAALKRHRPHLVITSFDRKWIPPSLDIPAYVPNVFSVYKGISGTLKAVREIYREFARPSFYRVPPIYAREDELLKYDQQRYPVLCQLMPAINAWEAIKNGEGKAGHRSNQRL